MTYDWRTGRGDSRCVGHEWGGDHTRRDVGRVLGGGTLGVGGKVHEEGYGGSGGDGFRPEGV